MVFRDWDRVAAREPYFAVYPAPKYLRANLTPAGEREFYQEGERIVRWMFDVIRPLAPDFSPVAALDYGCGPGHLTLALAGYAGVVKGVDNSPAMVAHARALALDRKLSGVEFGTPEAVLTARRQFDLVLCHLPLQRMPEPAGLALTRALIETIGKNGVGVFHFAYGDTAWLLGVTRWLRMRIPIINRFLNRRRGKPADAEFVPTYTYSLGSMLQLTQRVPGSVCHVVLDRWASPPRATVFVRMPGPDGAAHPLPEVTDATTSLAAPDINVRDLIARTPIEQLNRTAEEYFSTLTGWDHHLAKPFAKPSEAPPLLLDAGVLLQGLRLEPGLTVLDFGAGSGWLSRYVTQLGCRAILLDVSPTALKIAEELYRRLPVIGDQPAPTFLLCDGRRINLPDASVDRIVCFHAFHHTPNPDDMLREFGRVLRPGGVAAFVEPGPHHSRTPTSQFEMRTYGVIENDVDLHAIWRTASACGFDDLKVAVFHQPPFHVTLEDFDDLLTGGTTSDDWTMATRRFLLDVRTFFLTRTGARRADSRTPEGLQGRIVVTAATSAVSQGQPVCIDAAVTNTGSAHWLPWPTLGGVALGAHLYAADGSLLDFDFHCTPLVDPAREIAPGDTVTVRVTLPPLPAGRYRIEFDCVAAHVIWFAQAGTRPAVIVVEVLEP